MKMNNDPEAQALPEHVLSEDGHFVVGQLQGADYILVDGDGCCFGCDDVASEIDFAARFVSQSDAADAALERGLKVFEVVRSPGGLQLRVVH